MASLYDRLKARKAGSQDTQGQPSTAPVSKGSSLAERLRARKGLKDIVEVGAAQLNTKAEVKEINTPISKSGELGASVDIAIASAAQKHQIGEPIIRAIIKQESDFNPMATNPKSSAKGLMQLIDGTAKEMGVQDSFDPVQNVDGGVGYYKKMLAEFKTQDHAILAYHDGPQAMREIIAGKRKPSPEGLDYLFRVKQNLGAAAPTKPIETTDNKPNYSWSRAGGQLWAGTQDIIRGTGVGFGVVFAQQGKNLTPMEYAATIDDEENMDIINEARRLGVDKWDIYAERAAADNLADRQSRINKLIQASGERLMTATQNADWLKTNPDYLQSAGFFEDLLRATPQVAAQILVALGTGGLGSGAFMGAQILGSTYENQIAQGIPHEKALAAGFANAVMQAPLEMIGIGKVTKFWKPKAALVKKLSDLGKAMGTEGLTEFLQQIPEHATNLWAKNPDGKLLNEMWDTLSDWDEIKKWAPEGAKAAAIGAILGGGGHITGSAFRQSVEAAENGTEKPPTDKEIEELDPSAIQEIEEESAKPEDADAVTEPEVTEPEADKPTFPPAREGDLPPVEQAVIAQEEAAYVAAQEEAALEGEMDAVEEYQKAIEDPVEANKLFLLKQRFELTGKETDAELQELVDSINKFGVYDPDLDRATAELAEDKHEVDEITFKKARVKENPAFTYPELIRPVIQFINEETGKPFYADGGTAENKNAAFIDEWQPSQLTHKNSEDIQGAYDRASTKAIEKGLDPSTGTKGFLTPRNTWVSGQHVDDKANLEKLVFNAKQKKLNDRQSVDEKIANEEEAEANRKASREGMRDLTSNEENHINTHFKQIRGVISGLWRNGGIVTQEDFDNQLGAALEQVVIEQKKQDADELIDRNLLLEIAKRAGRQQAYNDSAKKRGMSRKIAARLIDEGTYPTIQQHKEETQVPQVQSATQAAIEERQGPGDLRRTKATPKRGAAAVPERVEEAPPLPGREPKQFDNEDKDKFKKRHDKWVQKKEKRDKYLEEQKEKGALITREDLIKKGKTRTKVEKAADKKAREAVVEKHETELTKERISEVAEDSDRIKALNRKMDIAKRPTLEITDKPTPAVKIEILRKKNGMAYGVKERAADVAVELRMADRKINGKDAAKYRVRKDPNDPSKWVIARVYVAKPAPTTGEPSGLPVRKTAGFRESLQTPITKRITAQRGKIKITEGELNESKSEAQTKRLQKKMNAQIKGLAALQKADRKLQEAVLKPKKALNYVKAVPKEVEGEVKIVKKSVDKAISELNAANEANAPSAQAFYERQAEERATKKAKIKSKKGILAPRRVRRMKAQILAEQAQMKKDKAQLAANKKVVNRVPKTLKDSRAADEFGIANPNMAKNLEAKAKRLDAKVLKLSKIKNKTEEQFQLQSDTAAQAQFFREASESAKGKRPNTLPPKAEAKLRKAEKPVTAPERAEPKYEIKPAKNPEDGFEIVNKKTGKVEGKANMWGRAKAIAKNLLKDNMGAIIVRRRGGQKKQLTASDYEVLKHYKAQKAKKQEGKKGKIRIRNKQKIRQSFMKDMPEGYTNKQWSNIFEEGYEEAQAAYEQEQAEIAESGMKPVGTVEFLPNGNILEYLGENDKPKTAAEIEALRTDDVAEDITEMKSPEFKKRVRDFVSNERGGATVEVPARGKKIEKTIQKTVDGIKYAASIPRKVGEVFSLDIKFRKFSERVGSAVKRYHSIKGLEQDLARKTAREWIKDARKTIQQAAPQKWKRLSTKEKKALLTEAVFMAESDTHAANVMHKDPKKGAMLSQAALNMRQYFEAIKADLNARGHFDFDFIKSAVTRATADLKGADFDKGQKLLKRLAELENQHFIHIPLATWFGEHMASEGQKAKWSPEFYNKVNEQVNLLRKRQAHSIKDLVDRKIIKKEDVNPAEIFLSYGRNVGQAKALLEIRDAAVRDGLAKAVKSRPRKGGPWVKGEAKSVFKGFWLDYRLAGVIADIEAGSYKPNAWDKAVAGVKLGQFFNPLFMPMYDLQQHMIMGRGVKVALAHPIQYTKAIGKSIKDVMYKTENYQTAARLGTFSKPFSNPFWTSADIVGDTEAATIPRRVGRWASALMGANLFRSWDKKLGIMGRLPLVKPMYNASWNVAWGLDEMIRMLSYNANRVEGMKKAESAQFAADVHADYADVPPKTRKFLNRFLFTPTYTIAMTKTQVTMVKNMLQFVANGLTAGKIKALNQTDRQRALALGGAMNAAVVAGAVAFMRHHGYEEEEWGRKFVKKFGSGSRAREIVINWATPLMTGIKVAHLVAALGADAEPGDLNKLETITRKVTWLGTPMYRLAIQLVDNRQGDGSPIWNTFDDPSEKLIDGGWWALQNTIRMFEMAKWGTGKSPFANESPKVQKRLDRMLADDATSFLRYFERVSLIFMHSRKTTDRRIAYQIQRITSTLDRDIQRSANKKGGVDRAEVKKWKDNAKSRIKELKTQLREYRRR